MPRVGNDLLALRVINVITKKSAKEIKTEKKTSKKAYQ